MRAVFQRMMVLPRVLRQQMRMISMQAAMRKGVLARVTIRTALVMPRWVVVVGEGVVTERTTDLIRMEVMSSARAMQMTKMMSSVECGDATATPGRCKQKRIWRTQKRLGLL